MVAAALVGASSGRALMAYGEAPSPRPVLVRGEGAQPCRPSAAASGSVMRHADADAQPPQRPPTSARHRHLARRRLRLRRRDRPTARPPDPRRGADRRTTKLTLRAQAQDPPPLLPPLSSGSAGPRACRRRPPPLRILVRLSAPVACPPLVRSFRMTPVRSSASGVWLIVGCVVRFNVGLSTGVASGLSRHPFGRTLPNADSIREPRIVLRPSGSLLRHIGDVIETLCRRLGGLGSRCSKITDGRPCCETGR